MIFISYRRADTGGHAGRLFDRLGHWFDADSLFYDQNGIDIGEVFPERIASALNNAAVVLVLIGPHWLDEINRRIDQPGVDFVRREVEMALARQADGTLVLPVLLDGAAMPAASQLRPELQSSLAPLCGLNAHEFRGNQADWNAQFVRLRERIAQTAGIPAPRFRAPPGVEQPFRVIDHLLSPHFQDPNGLLARLHAQLIESKNTQSGGTAMPARTALFGMGGVGKTQLALKYSYAYRDLYAGVCWFHADSETALQLDALACCQEASVPLRKGETPNSALKRWLEQQETPWLLVYDNAEDVAALRPHLPQSGPHHQIITSRNPAWGGLAQALELDVWSLDQALDFLLSRCSAQARDDLQRLAEALGGLPLALEQAASYLEETGAGVAAYCTLLTSVKDEGLILDEGRAATGYERSVAATLSIAFEKLSPAARQLLRLAAYAAPEPLPERFFHEAAAGLPAELAAAAVSTLAWNQTAGELRRYGLAERIAIAALERTPGAADERTEAALSLHRLTQQSTRARLAQPEQDGRALEAMLRTVCPAEANLPAHWPRFAALAGHVTQLDRYYAAGWLDSRAYSWLLDRVAAYLRAGPALYAESVRWLRRAWEIDQQELGETHPDTLASMANLANTLWAQGDLAGARLLQERALKTCRRVLGDAHPDTLGIMNNLAGSLRALGDLAGARALQEQVLQAHLRVLGETHADTLTSMNNLAETLRIQHDLTAARTLLERMLASSRKVLGEHHPSTLTGMNTLACTLMDQGDLAAAGDLLKRILAVRRRVLGEAHPDTVTSMNNLAEALRAQGDLAGARALQEQVLTVRRQVQGGAHPLTLIAMNNLALTLWKLNQREAALKLMQAAADGLAQALGPGHADALTARRTLQYFRQEAQAAAP